MDISYIVFAWRIVVFSIEDRPDVAPTINFNTPIMESGQTQFTCSGIVGRPAGRFVWRTSTNTQDLQIQTVSQTESSCLITRTEQLTLPLNRQNETVTISCEIEHNLVTSPLVTTVGPFDILCKYSLHFHTIKTHYFFHLGHVKFRVTSVIRQLSQLPFLINAGSKNSFRIIFLLLNLYQFQQR